METNNYERFETTIQKLLALPFVPENQEDIVGVFDTIVDKMSEDIQDEEQLTDVINYVERTYIRRRAARGRRPATNQRFPSNIWIVYALTMNRKKRATNAVEGFHFKFQRMIVSHHSGSSLNPFGRTRTKMRFIYSN